MQYRFLILRAASESRQDLHLLPAHHYSSPRLCRPRMLGPACVYIRSAFTGSAQHIRGSRGSYAMLTRRCSLS